MRPVGGGEAAHSQPAPPPRPGPLRSGPLAPSTRQTRPDTGQTAAANNYPNGEPQPANLLHKAASPGEHFRQKQQERKVASSSLEVSGVGASFRSHCLLQCPVQTNIVALSTIYVLLGILALIVAATFCYFESFREGTATTFNFGELLLGVFVKLLPPLMKLLVLAALLQLPLLWLFYALPKLAIDCLFHPMVFQSSILLSVCCALQCGAALAARRFAMPPPWLYAPAPEGETWDVRMRQCLHCFGP
eukprot:GHVT01073023.1.p1 GENE.GHVT01073023.1~~GHVT01073023.1.p1  ORF type:complete len:247 (+),score=39.56 GHVT01073023.1:368-1108(+)